MDNNTKTAKNNRATIFIIVIVLIGIVGVIAYQNGQENARKQMERIQAIENNRKRAVELKNIIPQKEAKLQMEINNYNDINSFHFLRSSAEKEQQLAAQNRIVDSLRDQLSKLRNELSTLGAINY